MPRIDIDNADTVDEDNRTYVVHCMVLMSSVSTLKFKINALVSCLSLFLQNLDHLRDFARLPGVALHKPLNLGHPLALSPGLLGRALQTVETHFWAAMFPVSHLERQASTLPLEVKGPRVRHW